MQTVIINPHLEGEVTYTGDDDFRGANHIIIHFPGFPELYELVYKKCREEKSTAFMYKLYKSSCKRTTSVKLTGLTAAEKTIIMGCGNNVIDDQRVVYESLVSRIDAYTKLCSDGNVKMIAHYWYTNRDGYTNNGTCPETDVIRFTRFNLTRDIHQYNDQYPCRDDMIVTVDHY